MTTGHLIYKKYIFYELWYLTSNETTWLLEYDNVENNTVMLTLTMLIMIRNKFWKVW
jgi:hypothetical protein